MAAVADPNGFIPLPPHDLQLFHAFRVKYKALEGNVDTALKESTGDSVVMERLGDQLDEFAFAVKQVGTQLHLSSSVALITHTSFVFSACTPVRGARENHSRHQRPYPPASSPTRLPAVGGCVALRSSGRH